jgi:hypothetical protein
LPPGDYYLDFPDIAMDVDAGVPSNRPLLSKEPITRDKLILVPSNVKISGDLDSSGRPLARIHWKATSFPILSFIGVNNSGLANLAFVFDGEQPHFFPWWMDQYLSAVGVAAAGIGGPPSLATAIFALGANSLRVENVRFASSHNPPDNLHTLPIAASIYGNPMKQGENPSSYVGSCTTDNTFRNIKLSDFVMGLVVVGQCNAVFENIQADHRGSWFRSFEPARERPGQHLQFIGPPGHVIYVAPTPRMALCRNITIRDIKESEETLADVNSLGTLALKNIQGGIVENIDSQHPAGLIQIMENVHGLTLKNLTWASKADLCATGGDACKTPALGIAGDNSDVTFTGVHLTSNRWAARIHFSGAGEKKPRGITMEDVEIDSVPLPSKGDVPRAMITIVDSSDIKLTHVRYKPLPLPNGSLPPAPNGAVQVHASQNVSVDIGIRKMSANGPGSDAIYKSQIDEHKQNNPKSGLDGKSVIVQHEISNTAGSPGAAQK